MASNAEDVQDAIRVAVVDDDEPFRGSLMRLLTAAGLQVRGFSSARQFLESPDCNSVFCVVSDLRMPGVDGLQLQAELRHALPHLSIVFLTGYADVTESVSAMKAGAVDFLEKPVSRPALMDAIERAAARSRHLKHEAIELEALRARFETLTPRERQVLMLVSVGLLNKQMAAELGSALKTVKQHRGQVMRKMRAESATDLAIMAQRLGIRPEKADFSNAKGRRSSPS